MFNCKFKVKIKAITYDDPVGRHLGRGGLTNPPQKEQCRKTVRTVLRTRPGV